MAGINKAIILGNVGKDPEIRTSADGRKIANFSVATSETWKDKSGEKQEKTEWHRVVVFNPHLAEIVEKYIQKGSKVYVEGSMKTRKWTDNNGLEKYTTEIVLSQFAGEIQICNGKDGGNSSAYPPAPSEEDYRAGSKPKGRLDATTPEGYREAKGYAKGRDPEGMDTAAFNDDIPF